jgi:hypothetical protein
MDVSLIKHMFQGIFTEEPSVFLRMMIKFLDYFKGSISMFFDGLDGMMRSGVFSHQMFYFLAHGS